MSSFGRLPVSYITAGKGAKPNETWYDPTYSFNSSHFLSFLLFIPLGHTPSLIQIPNKPLFRSDMS
jgi:hypothetical protein